MSFFCLFHSIFRFSISVSFGDEVMKIRKYYVIFVYILQGKMEKNGKDNHKTKVTKIPKSNRRKYGMNETSVSLDFRWIFVYPCKKLQNWSHTIWSTNDIKVFDVDGSSNFIPACRGVFFCNLPWFFFVFAGRAEAAVSWSSVVQSSTMCRNGWVTRCTILT